MAAARATGPSAAARSGVQPHAMAALGFEARTRDGMLRLLIGLDRVAVAMRCSAGTKSALPGVVTRETKSVMDFFTAPSFHEGSGSGWAAAR